MKRTSILALLTVFAASGLGFAGDFSEGDRLFTIKGNYDMLSREGLLLGGETIGQDVLAPGHPEKSFFMEAIRWEDPDFEMPPKENDRLTEEQIAQVERWIKLGAPWPEESIQLAIDWRSRALPR